MKISPATISILKNFATINQSILIKPGNILATQDTVPSIRSIAQVTEEFPVRVAIYDLHKFLGTLAMMGDCDVDFQERKAVLKLGKQQAEYIYSNGNMVKEASVKRPTGGEFFTCHFSDRDISTILKAAAVFSAPMLSFVGENKVATLYIGTPKSENFDSPSDTFRLELGECEDEFDLRIPVEVFKVIPSDYNVVLNRKKFIHLASTTTPLEYWLAADPESTV